MHIIALIAIDPIERTISIVGIVCTIALTVAGVIGICIALKTLRAIQLQAHEMKRQRGFMRLQWKAMGEQATLMNGQLREMEQSREIETKTLILQFRPKIIVRNAKASEFNVFELGEPATGRALFTVVNAGGSAAHITDGTIAMWSVKASDHKMEQTHGTDWPIGEFTLQPGEDRTLAFPLNTGAVNDLDWANYHAGLRTEPLKFIYLAGVLQYLDDLKILRRTGIMREYDPKTKLFAPSKTSEAEYSD